MSTITFKITLFAIVIGLLPCHLSNGNVQDITKHIIEKIKPPILKFYLYNSQVMINDTRFILQKLMH